MFSTKSPGEDSGGNPVQIIQSLPWKGQGKFIGRLEMEKSSLCTANTWLIKRSCIWCSCRARAAVAAGAAVCDGWLDHTGIINWGGSGRSLLEWFHRHSRAVVTRDEKPLRGIRTCPFWTGWDTGSVAVSPLGALQSRISSLLNNAWQKGAGFINNAFPLSCRSSGGRGTIRSAVNSLHSKSNRFVN